MRKYGRCLYGRGRKRDAYIRYARDGPPCNGSRVALRESLM